MRIRRVEIDGLFGKDNTFAFDLNEDLNILTGRNGAGKTSILKLLCYVMSGNIGYALQEIPFVRVRLLTDLYDCTVYRVNENTCRVNLFVDGKLHELEDVSDDENDVILEAQDLARDLYLEKGSSIFLPTFRRIEAASL